MRTKVVGVTFSNEDGSSRTRIIAGMTESDKICLERDPYNQYDANAVKVCVLKNGEKKQIGFLAKEIAAEVSPKLRRNGNYNVSIVGVGIWNDRPFCELEITEAPTPAPKSESSTSISNGPTFTPSRPTASQPNTSGPAFSPSRPAASQPNTSGPAFTPSRSTAAQPNTSSPAFTPSRPTSQPKPASVSSTPVSTPSSAGRTTQQKSNNSGCLGIFIGIAVVITALLMI